MNLCGNSLPVDSGVAKPGRERQKVLSGGKANEHSGSKRGFLPKCHQFTHHGTSSSV